MWRPTSKLSSFRYLWHAAERCSAPLPNSATPPNTHPFLVRNNVVAAMLLGQVRRQDIKAATELRENHVVGVS